MVLLFYILDLIDPLVFPQLEVSEEKKFKSHHPVIKTKQHACILDVTEAETIVIR